MRVVTDQEYVRRAMAAWFKSESTGQPSEASAVYEANHRRYVELVNARGTLAVYRIDNAGRLKRLKRWPKRERLGEQASGTIVMDGGVKFIDEEEDGKLGGR